ncbi:hypothetical protein [Kaarinaea lacus]
MGQDAFVERYNKPNHRFHVVVFVAIVAVSVFLATQVEKTKDKTDIAALKNPVPIDSIGIIKSDAQDKVPSIKSPVVNRDLSPESTSQRLSDKKSIQEQEYVFDDEPNLDSIAELLNPEQSIITPDSDSSTENVALQSEVGVTEAGEESGTEPGPDLMDQAYQKQQDRFLETLARSAELETQDSFDIKKLREAIRSDKPLVRTEKKSESTVIANSSNTNTASAKSITAKETQTINKVTNADEKRINVKSEFKLPGNQNLQQASLTSTSKIPVSKKVETPIMTKGELNKIVSQFARSYNEGDIVRLMALFTDNARTNDQKNKSGIKADYAELFNNTETRNLMIKDIKWRLGNGKAEGAAAFVVTVQPKNSDQRNLYKGQIKITAVSHSKGVYITRLIHELNQ